MTTKRRTTALASFLVVAAWALGGAARAELCSVDPVPAATLLVPYFEVDFTNPGVSNTIITVRNTLPEPALVHTTLWTDWGAPTLDFDLFLTGYGLEEIDLYALFVDGDLPITADEQTDPMDLISPHGRPEWDGSFPECQNFFPFPPGVVNGTLRARVQQGHSGQPVDHLGGDCLGGPQEDGLARGYVTLDNVSQCSVLFPSDLGYFVEGGLGVANDLNQLTGEARIVHELAGESASIGLAHIEADPDFESTTGATFYGRLVGNDGSDDREPLASAWSAPFQGAGTVSLLPPAPLAGTELLVWRDPGSSEVSQFGVACDVGPSWFPLSEKQGVCFGLDNAFDSTCFGRDCFPRALNRAFVADLEIPFERGFCQLNLDGACPGCLPGGAGVDGSVHQSFVTVLDRYPPAVSSRAHTATATWSACEESSPTVDTGELFADGFEGGSTSVWN